MSELIIKEVSSELLKYTHSLICTFDPFCVSPLIFHPNVCDQLASDNLWHRGTANPLVTKSTRNPCRNKAHGAQALQRHNHKVESTCVSSKHKIKKTQKYMSHKQEAQNTCRKGTQHRAHAAEAHSTYSKSTMQKGNVAQGNRAAGFNALQRHAPPQWTGLHLPPIPLCTHG